MPIGDYTRRLLRRLRMSSVLTSNKVSQQSNVGQVLSQVAFGGADAGFVYVTDARTQPDRIDPLYVPQWAQPPVRYQGCVVIRDGADTRGRAGAAGRDPLLARPRAAQALRVRAAAAGMIRRAGTARWRSAIVVAFLAVPVIALFVAGAAERPAVAAAPPRGARRDLGDGQDQRRRPTSLLLGFGTPAAWVLATRRFPGRAPRS